MSDHATAEPAAAFHAASSRGQPLSLADFEGKVPLAIAFLDELEPNSQELAELDRRQIGFGRRRTQLLVIVRADGPDVRAVPWTGLDLPVLADPHGDITARFAEGSYKRRFYVLVDPHGMIVERGDLESADALLDRVDANADRLGMTVG